MRDFVPRKLAVTPTNFVQHTAGTAEAVWTRGLSRSRSRRHVGDVTGIRDRSRGHRDWENACGEKSLARPESTHPVWGLVGLQTDELTRRIYLLFANLTRRYSAGGNVCRAARRFYGNTFKFA